MTLFALIEPATARNVLLVLVGGCYLGYHLYHLWRWLAEKKTVKGEPRNFSTGSEGMVGASVPLARNQAAADSARVDDCGHAKCVTLPTMPTVRHSEDATIRRPPPPPPPPPPSPSPPPPPQPPPSPSLSGEELYAQARAIPHQPIPDCEMDGEYLRLLVKSADLGYARAASKLGEYAIRRACMVEAYYWFSMAKKYGMRNLERTMQQIRSIWANGGFHRESANEYEQFPHERGSVGYALLCRDSGHNANAAKAYLAECAPDLLKRG